MRQLSIVISFLIISYLYGILPTFSAVKGGIEYSIPIDYSKLSEEELKDKARSYYIKVVEPVDEINQDDLTNALFLYSVLSKINPNSIEYAVKMGVLNDKLDKPRLAKGYFSKAVGIDFENPQPYFYFGEFYYRRNLLRKALHYFNRAYASGFEKHYLTLYRIGCIYEKLGDTRSALNYLRQAQEQNNNPDLENAIKRVESQDSINKEYYSETRIRIQ